MHSEYEKQKDSIKAKKQKGQKSEKDKEAGKQNEIDEKEFESKISEAESLEICTLDPEVLAEELTLTEVKIVMDITPVEVLKFSYENESEASPTLVAYIKFTDGLSSYVTSTILDCIEEPTQVAAKKKFHAQSEVITAQRHWIKVMERLLERNNKNSLTAIFKGILKTNPTRIMKEEILDLLKKASETICQETEKEMQSSNTLYIRDIRSLEKHLIDASYHKNDKESPNKFRRIIEYLNYIRAHAPAKIDEKINHALIHTFRNSKDIRVSVQKEGSVLYSGCFLFLEHSRFISSE